MSKTLQLQTVLQTIAKAFSKWVFLAKITASSIFFITQTLLVLIVDTSKNSRVLICVYLLLLTQALLVLFSTNSNAIEPAQTTEEHLQLIGKHIDPIFLEERLVSQLELKEDFHQENNGWIVPETRNGLINAAIISLDNEDKDEFSRLLEKARELDPNWRGWAKQASK